METNQKKKIVLGLLFGISSLLIVLGVLFLLSAAEIAPIIKGFYGISNVLVRYIIVIVTMAVGIMTFSNAASRLRNRKARNGVTIAITTFSTILTVPLVYVFIAIFFAQNGIVGPVGEIMMLGRIAEGFHAWFGNGGFVYVVYVFMLLLSIVFICVPLFTCVLTCKGKTLHVGKKQNGKFGAEIVELTE